MTYAIPCGHGFFLVAEEFLANVLRKPAARSLSCARCRVEWITLAGSTMPISCRKRLSRFDAAAGLPANNGPLMAFGRNGNTAFGSGTRRRD